MEGIYILKVLEKLKKLKKYKVTIMIIVLFCLIGVLPVVGHLRNKTIYSSQLTDSSLPTTATGWKIPAGVNGILLVSIENDTGSVAKDIIKKAEIIEKQGNYSPYIFLGSRHNSYAYLAMDETDYNLEDKIVTITPHVIGEPTIETIDMTRADFTKTK